MRGPVDLGNLGQTLMHEHVFVLSTEHVQNYGSDWWDEEAMVARAIDKLNAVYAKGVHTIVDPTVWGLGRDIPRMQRIAAQTPMNIIVAAGLYYRRRAARPAGVGRHPGADRHDDGGEPGALLHAG